MENIILNELKNELDFREKIVVKLNKKLILKVYNKGRDDYFLYLVGRKS